MNKERIDENIALITEMLSVSDEVVAVGDNIIDDVEKKYLTYPCKQLKKGLFKRYGVEHYNLWGHNVSVEFNIFDYTDKDVFDEEVEKNSHTNNFRFKKYGNRASLTLTLGLDALYGTISRMHCEDAVYHEVEHLYQWCKKNPININRKPKGLMNQAYNYATSKLNYKAEAVERKLALIMYYSNPREQDALAHEYYSQAQQSLLTFQNGETQTDKRFNQYRKAVAWLRKSINDPTLKQYLEVYKQYGYTPDNILSYATKGLKRFYRKMNHVRNLVNMTTNERIPFNDEEFEEEIIRDKENLIQEITDRIMEKIKS